MGNPRAMNLNPLYSLDKLGSPSTTVASIFLKENGMETGVGLRDYYDLNEGLRYSLIPMGNLG